MANVHYCLCVTSCNRFDLLQMCLDSFIQTMDVKPRCTIIVDDSEEPMPLWLRENIHRYTGSLGPIKWLSNGGRMGQVYSIDRLVNEIPRDLERVCWLEDDWKFTKGGYLQRSLELLDRYSEISQVVWRSDWAHTLVDDPRFEGFKVAQPFWKGDWGGWTWNPHVTRKSELRRFGTYASQAGYQNGLKHELVFSKKFLDAGMRIAVFPEHVYHTGGTRSRAIEPLTPLPKVLIAIPVCHKFDYTKWESGDSPIFDKSIAYNGEAYGTGIHISGDNNRIQALRDTWLKDVAKYPNVEYKLFYGRPHNREPQSDEVFLGCGDTYGDLPAKTIEICKYAQAHDYGYIFKADDDTAVYVDRILHEILTTRCDYGGYTHGRVCTGGTGYWLSRRAFTIVAEKASLDHWAEDVVVGKALFTHGILPVHLDGHRTGASDHWVYPTGYNSTVDLNGVTSFHAVQPDVMRQWYEAKERK